MSPAASRVPPRGMTMERSCSAATSTTPAGSSSDATGDPTSGDSAPSRYSSSSMRPPTKTPASVAPGARTTRSMCSASSASGQMISSIPKCCCRPRAPPESRSSRLAKQIVRRTPSLLARAQQTKFTSSSRVAAMKAAHRSTPARRSTSGLAPLPATNSTSSSAKRSPTAGSASTTKTSWAGARACASG